MSRLPVARPVAWPAILVLSLTFGLSPGLARAQSPDDSPDNPVNKPADEPANEPANESDEAALEQSKELFLKGSEAAERGDSLQARRKSKRARKAYAAAATHFLAAYRAAPNPYFLFSLGEVYRARGDSKWARACYGRFVDLAPTFDDSKAGQAARDSLPEAKRHLGKLSSARKLTGAAKLEPIGVCTQLAGSKARPDGSAEPGGESDDRPGGELDGRPGDGPDDPSVTPPARDPGSSGRGVYRAGFFTSVGLTATSLALAGVFHVQVSGALKDEHLAAVNAYQDATGQVLPFDNTCAGARDLRDGASGNEAQLLDDVIGACNRGESRARLGNTMQIVALVSAMAAGVFLYKGYLQKGKRSRERVSIIAPVITPERVGAHWLLRF